MNTILHRSRLYREIRANSQNAESYIKLPYNPETIILALFRNLLSLQTRQQVVADSFALSPFLSSDVVLSAVRYNVSDLRSSGGTGVAFMLGAVMIGSDRCLVLPLLAFMVLVLELSRSR
jgi:hypothetical protein